MTNSMCVIITELVAIVVTNVSVYKNTTYMYLYTWCVKAAQTKTKPNLNNIICL